MAQFGLVGKTLGHSFSKKYFSEKWRNQDLSHSYSNLEFENSDTLEAFKTGKSKELTGFNVTIPYKEDVYNLCDELSVEAKAIGAVNCVKVVDGKWIGFNTDAYGFSMSIEDFDLNNQKAIILGSGGASKALKYALTEKGADVKITSRNPKSNSEISYNELNDLLKNIKLIVNATPLGMHPNINECPNIDYTKLNSNSICIDIIYNPASTLFMQKCLEQGCFAKNGLEMLINQAEKSWEIWQG